MEYASGNELFDYIVSNRRLQENEACKFFRQIISGIEYLHKLSIVHRDLKPESLLLDHNKEIKIGSFGLSNLYPKGALLKTPCGSPCYAAPEMIAGGKYQGLNVDIWSSGIILFVMICGYLPFDDSNNDDLYKKICEGKFSIPNWVSEQGKDLLKKILITDPGARYTLSQIKSHSWFNLHNGKYSMGLLVNITIIPIDEKIISKMEEHGFNSEEVRKNILDNRHNHITTTYYLILKKLVRAGSSSISDLISPEFLNYLAQPFNLVENRFKEEDSIKKDTGYEILNENQETYETQMNNLFQELETKNADSSNKVSMIKPKINPKIEKFLSKLNEELNKQFNILKDKLEKQVYQFVEEIENEVSSEKQVIDKTVHEGYICGGCDKDPLIGIRYKCAVCENFDLCEKCEEVNKNNHPHPFIKIRCPDRAPSKIAVSIYENINKLPVEQNKTELSSSNHKYEFYDKTTEILIEKKSEDKPFSHFEHLEDFMKNNGDLKLGGLSKLKYEYGTQYKLMVSKYQLVGVSEEKIYNALNTAKGNIDLAFFNLFEEVQPLKTENKETDIQKLRLLYGKHYESLIDTYSLNGISEEKILLALEKSKGKKDIALSYLI